MVQPQLENAIFITGGGQRIGAYLVRSFLEKTDFPVVFTYRTEHPEVKELVALGAKAIQCDFDQVGALERLVEILQQQVKSLRAVIHNASIWLDDREAPVFSAGYQSMFRLHVETPQFLNEHLQPLLQASDSALKDIISLSDFSVQKASETHAAYLSSKAALQNLSQNFAKKYAPHIKVNDIAPALIMFNEGDAEDYKKRRLKQAALPIEPGPEVVWKAIKYVMENPYLTGSIQPLNGGRNLF